MKKIVALLGILFVSSVPVFGSAGGCTYDDGNPLGSFKNCSPTGVIQAGSKPDLEVTDSGSDFMTLTQRIVSLLQTIAFYFAVGIIVWLGVLMVIPGNGEAKEATKSKLVSVLLGFLAMISATIVVNVLINLIYDILP